LVGHQYRRSAARYSIQQFLTTVEIFAPHECFTS
jgi:hypothetical protein